MTKIILHGGYTAHDNEQNNAFWHALTEDLSDRDEVLFVLFSREGRDEDPRRWESELWPRVQRQASAIGLQYREAEKETFIEQIASASAIYFLGGDTKYLIDTVRGYSELQEAIKGKTVAGDSAGAYLFSTWFQHASTGEVEAGLGILPIRLICHYESEHFDVGEVAVEKMETLPEELELVVLRDYEYRVFEIEN